MKEGMRERERERGLVLDGVCDCSLGELLENKKLFRPLYIFKYAFKLFFVLFI